MSTMNRLGLAAALLAMAGGAGLAYGLPDPQAEEGVKGSYNRPLRGARAEPPPMEVSSFTMVMSHSDGADRYTLRITDGRVEADVNGKPVPEDRIRRDREKVAILGEKGEVLHEFRVGTFGPPEGIFRPEPPPRPAPPMRVQRDPQGRFRLERAEPEPREPALEAPPPVMIGITMSDPDPGVLEFLDVESAIRIDRTVKDLPADKAGLREGDLITHVNGKPASQRDLREMLASAKPGDELTLRVFRKGGESREIKLTLVAYDEKQLASVMPRDEGAREPFNFFGERFGPARDEAMKRLEEVMKMVREKVDGRRLQEELVAALERAREAFGDAQERLQHFDWRQLVPHEGPGFFGEPGRGRIFTVPAPGLDEPDRRREELSRRVDQLDRRLDEINRRLEELRELLQAQAGQRPPPRDR